MIACSTCGGRGTPSSEGFFSVSLWTPHDGIRRQLPGHAAVQGGAHWRIHPSTAPGSPYWNTAPPARSHVFRMTDTLFSSPIENRAAPKSSSLLSPLEVMEMLSGLISRVGSGSGHEPASTPASPASGWSAPGPLGNLPALGCNVCLQAHAVDIFHHEIGRVVFLKIILHDTMFGVFCSLARIRASSKKRSMPF